jgi:hypothetical protein
MADDDNTTGGAGGTAGGTSKNKLTTTSKTAGHSYVTADQDREATDGDTLYYPQELFTDSQPNGIQFFINARRFGKDNTVEDMNGNAAATNPNVIVAEEESDQNRSQADQGEDAQKQSGAVLAALLAGYQANKFLAGNSGLTKTAGSMVAAAGLGTAVNYAMDAGNWIQNMETVRLLKSIQLHVPQSIVAGYTANWNEAELGIAGILGRYGNSGDFFGDGGLMENIANGEGAEFFTRNLIAGAANIPKAAGANADLGALFEVTSKKVNNPFKEQLFKSMGFRKFAFNYVFSPRNPGEAKMVQDIVKTFKYHMHPDIEEKGMFLIYPSEFAIEFMHKDENTGEVSRNMNLPKVSSCALTNVKVTYGPDGMFNTFANTGGMPTETTVELAFTELETLTRRRIQDGL